MTPRLYHDDPLLCDFEARVVAHGAWKGVPSVLLDRTAFYPEAGGQMADHGTLAGQPVLDVQVDDAGAVHHVLGGPLPAVGTEVAGHVDRGRRRVHMSLHTGQHMLSRALLDVAGGGTVSSRLGESACTIDIDLEKVDERAVARAEELVNAVIDDDAPIRAWFPEPAELRELPLRREPAVQEHVRVIRIGDFDVSPCGGTHCLRTAQVGLVRVTGVERYKGKMRVTFAAGRRARDELSAHSAHLREVGREMACGPLDVGAALDRVRRELMQAREALGKAQGELAAQVAERLCAAATGPHVVACLEDAPVEYLRAVGEHVSAREGVVALLATRRADGLRMFVARGTGSSFDCGAFVKRAAQAAGGRGGGRPERAEGQLPAAADWAGLVASLLGG